MESEPKFDFNESADSRLISSGLKLQELSRKRMMANYLPTLSTFYSWRENRVGDEFSMLSKADFRVTGGNILGVNLSVPLFQGFSQRSRVQQASLELKKIRVQQTQAMQGYSLQSAQALGEFRSALNTFNNSRESVALARKIRDKSAVKYREGVGSSIELMQAENELLNAQGNYISSATQLLNARVNLDKQLNKF
jgi:outer membrane protein TolC